MTDVEDKSKITPNWYAWVIIIILMVMYTSSFIDRQILGLLVTPIRARFSVSDTEFSLLTGLSFALLYSVTGIPLGYVVDRWNRKLVIVLGVICWSVMTATCGLVSSFSALFIARVGVGLGEATLSPATYSLVPDLFAPHKLARALSVFGLGVPIGSGLALVIGGPLVQTLTETGPVNFPIAGLIEPWQQVFLIIGLPGILLGLIAFFAIREPERTSAPTSAMDEKTNLANVLAELWDNRAAYFPLFFGFTFVALYWYGAAAWLPSYLQRVKGFSVASAGLFLGLSTLFLGILGTYTAGWLADRLMARGYDDAHFRVSIGFGLAGLICGCLGVTVTNDGLSLAFLFMYGLFAFTLVGVNAAALQLVTPPKMRGRVSAIYLFVLNLVSLGLGPTLVALCTDYLFMNELEVGKSIALVGAIGVSIGCAIMQFGRKAVALRISALRGARTALSG